MMLFFYTGVLVLQSQFDTVLIIVVVFERPVLAIKGGKERTSSHTYNRFHY